MNSAPQPLLLVCLLSLCVSPLRAQPRNPYDLEMQTIQSRWNTRELEGKLLLLDRAWELRDYVDQRSQIELWLGSMARSGSEVALVRNEANAYLCDLLALQGIADCRASRHWYDPGYDPGQAAAREQVLARAKEATHDGTGESLQTLAELELLGGVPAARDHMVQAARVMPDAGRWERVATMAEDPFQKFAALRAGLDLEPNHARLNLDMAGYYIGRRQLEKARELLTLAATASPDDFVVRERLASLYLDLGLRSAALSELRTLEEQWPHPLWLRARLALDYEQMSLWDDADRLASSVVAEDHANRGQLELLTRIHERRHMTCELEADYQALIHLDPRSPALLLRSGPGAIRLRRTASGPGFPAARADSRDKSRS